MTLPVAIVQMPGADANHGGPQTPRRIVIHGTVSPDKPGYAVGNARYVDSVGLSVHYYVDPSVIVAQVPEDLRAWHDGDCVDSIGIELCDEQNGDAARWDDENSTAILANAAALVADIAARWGIPLTRLTADQVRNRQSGIHGHAETSAAWPEKSNHTDPGPDFPWDRFLALIQGDDMPLTQADANLVADTILTRLVPLGATADKTTLGALIQWADANTTATRALIGASTTDVAAKAAAAVKAAGVNVDPGALAAEIIKQLAGGTK